MADWQSALTSQTAASYRTAEPTIPEEELWRIVEDPGADESVRAGAAVALRARGGDRSFEKPNREDDATTHVQVRLRLAAQASASPRVRIALEAAADAEEDGELARALEVFTR